MKRGNCRRTQAGMWIRVIGCLLALALGIVQAQDEDNVDPRLAEMEAQFNRAVQEQTSELNQRYVKHLERLEVELVESGDYTAAAMVVAEIEQVMKQSLVLRELEVKVPENGVIELLADRASLDGVERVDGVLRNWSSDGSARWGFSPVPAGGYRVVVTGRALSGGELVIKAEEPYYFLTGEREFEEGEEFSWELGYLRLQDACTAFRCLVLSSECNFQIEKIQLFSPTQP